MKVSVYEICNLCFKIEKNYSVIFNKQTQEPAKQKQLFKDSEKKRRFRKWPKHIANVRR